MKLKVPALSGEKDFSYAGKHYLVFLSCLCFTPEASLNLESNEMSFLTKGGEF